MGIKKLIIMIFIFLSVFYAQKTNSVEGYVYNDRNEPFWGANVLLLEKNNGAATDKNGYFKIENIKSDTVILTISYIGFISKTDTIVFVSDKSNIKRKYILDCVFTEINLQDDPNVENYHLNLLNSAGENELIDFEITELKYNERGNLYFHSTIKNNTDYDIYILQEKECIRPFDFVVQNSEGEKINPNMISLSCDTRFFYNPDTTDLIKIPPKGIFKYPETVFWLYGFKQFPNDTYRIQVVYNQPVSKTILIYFEQKKNYLKEYSSEIKARQIMLRGIYKSNKLSFTKCD